MDPISALGIASGVITFVEFAGKLISTTRVIYNSPKGASAEDLKIEDVYDKLLSLSTRLQTSHDPGQRAQDESESRSLPQAHRDGEALQQLAKACSTECQKIISVVQDFRVQGDGHRVWKSVVAAFKRKLGEKEIRDIEQALERYQRVMSLQVSSILSNQVYQLSQSVEAMHSSMQDLEQNSRFKSMNDDLAKLEQEKSQLAGNFSDTSGATTVIVSLDQVQNLKEYLSNISKHNHHLISLQLVIESLNHESRPVRHSAIPQAHKNTFEWAFDHTNLATWLKSEPGIFWVSGKAGSGKSTFMKFLADHPKTRKLLENWAG